MKNFGLVFISGMLLILGQFSFAQQSRLNIYGFFDMEAEVNNKNSAGKKWTFDQHHLNILASYQLDDQYRVATEIEWEHGPMFSSSGGSGNIYLAKAFLEYKYSDAFLVRAGKFMSPFGIYNERHDATPTFLSTFLPSSVYGKWDLSFGGEGRLFAKHATGVQILGNLFNQKWALKYQVYISNGRGPDESAKDNNNNKGFGWRFVLSPPVEELRIGISYYSDKNGVANNAKQSTLGFDAEFDISSFHLEAEYFLPHLEKIDTSGTPIGKFWDVNGYYILAAYTFFDRLTPFARYEFFDPDIDVNQNGENIIIAGINYALSTSVYFKAEVHGRRFQDASIKKYEMFVSSISVAF